jgi:glycosyltransferase involved in cell wall biosynthesis
MADFEAAVRSVTAQSYHNWELVIVDDASGSPELTARIKAFAQEDKRIKPVFLKKNGGISNATNAAIAKARGHYIAFFDHDDMLMPRALEFMLGAALRTGARMLYCDEDKIDDFGVYSEVNLKPDWNYRLLLSQNYIYRAVDHIAAAGALDAFEDGPWGQKYPTIVQSWRRAWSEVIPFYVFPGEVRRILYTTKAIEALNAKLRRAVQARGPFPTDDAAMKLLFLVLHRAEKAWIMPPREWTMAKAQFAILFGERFSRAQA